MYTRVRFEWDEEKNRRNRAKHGMDFEFARLAFADPFAVARQDRDVDGEQRWQLIGCVFERVILVAHTLVAHTVQTLETDPAGEEQAIRIISARKATRAERRVYEESATD